MKSKQLSRPITIAIDGYSSCGKSTLAKYIAQHFNIMYIDSGAMYRAVAYYFLTHGIDLADNEAVERALCLVDIAFDTVDNSPITCLNGQNVEDQIRSLEVSSIVSLVAAMPPVRKLLVNCQRKMAGSKSIVMDGRDIGTVVFPHADVKLFLTARHDVRVERRFNELMAKGKIVDRASISKNLEERDHIDSSREDSPLIQAEDAILIDNSDWTLLEQQAKVLDIIYRILSTKMPIHQLEKN